MAVLETANGPVLYTVSRVGGGDLLAFRLGENGSQIQIDAQGLPGTSGSGSPTAGRWWMMRWTP